MRGQAAYGRVRILWPNWMVLLCLTTRLNEWTEISVISCLQMPARGGVEQVFKRRVDFRKNLKNPIIRAAQ